MRTPALQDARQASDSFFVLFALFSFELIAISVARMPESMRFDRYAFCDHGANLTLQYLISQGLKPSIDFGYAYGLLPAIFGRIWFAIFGATSWSYQAAMEVFAIVFAWAIAKTLAQLKIGWVGVALTITTAGYAYQATYVNFAHAIEAALISHAIAEQACGRRINALALASVSVFAKPAMGFVYSLLLAVLIVGRLISDGVDFRRWAAAFAPTAIAFVSIAVALASIYGTATFIHTALPMEGARNYRALNFGITRAGANFWDPPGLPWSIYLVDVSGFWILATVLLFFAAAYQLVHVYVGGATFEARSEILVTCAILHLAFVALFFGNQSSWIYYSYLLVIGCAIAADLGRNARRIGLVLCAIAFFSWTDMAYLTYRWWKTTAPDAATAGLWAPPDERAEWVRVLAKARGRKAVMLEAGGGATELLFPEFEQPVSLFLLKGLMTPAEIQRKTTQISGAEIVIVSKTIKECSGVPKAAEFNQALKPFEFTSGKYFDIYQRGSAPR
jgi:hypothetical protein